MSVSIHRIGDPNSAGAPVISTPSNSNVFANGILIAVNGSPVQGHGKGSHANPFTANGSSNVFINNTPVNRTGDADTCDHPRATGSPNVFVN